MRHRSRFTGKVRAVFAVFAVGGLVGACSGSNGGFSDPVEDLLGDPLVMMGLKVDPTKEEIQYGPRSPLVMPGETRAQDLPPPADEAGTYHAQWPNDPDEQQRRNEAALRKAARDEKPREVEYASKPMSPGDLNDWGRMYGRNNGAGVTTGPRGKEENKVVSSRELLDRRLDPNELTSEPARNSLTEPPPGYRTPAPPVEGQEQPQEKKGFFARLFGRS